MSPLTFKVLPRIRMQPQIASTWLHEGLKYNLDLTAENKTSYIPCTLGCVDIPATCGEACPRLLRILLKCVFTPWMIKKPRRESELSHLEAVSWGEEVNY